MRGALLILKKEFLEFSKDRKTMFFTLVMPLLLYPLLFTMMTKLGQNDADKRKGKASRVALVDPGNLLKPLLEADTRKFELVPRPEGDLKQALRDQKLDLYVEVESSAAEKANRNETYEITVYRDKSDQSSQLGVSRLKEMVQTRDRELVAQRLRALNASEKLAEPTAIKVEEAGDEARNMSKALGSFLPYMVMLMMFSGSMQHGIYATAGEKERGTLLSLLATSLPRNQIIWGKLLYIFCMGVIASLLNLVSMGFSFTRVVAAEQAAHAGTAVGASFGASALGDPLVLLLTFTLMVPLGLLFANVILLLGIQAKNTVEAGTSIMPILFVVIFLGVFSMAPGIEKMAALPYVPVVNVSLAIRKLFAQQASTLEYLVALLMTLGLAGIMTWVSTRLLNREAAIFRA